MSEERTEEVVFAHAHVWNPALEKDKALIVAARLVDMALESLFRKYEIKETFSTKFMLSTRQGPKYGEEREVLGIVISKEVK
jgi:hypothetical protein